MRQIILLSVLLSMAFNYPLIMPATPAPSRILWEQVSNVAMAVSPFTNQQQTQEHQGDGWRVQITMPAMRRAQAEPWLAFLSELRGRNGTFLISPYGATTALGNPSGTPLVSGANQVGFSLNTDGWATSISGLLLAGDFIQLSSLLQWENQTSPEDNGWLKLAWSPELSLFAAVASSGNDRVMTSPDGITWTARNSADDAKSWADIVWVPELGLFVSVAGTGTGNRVMTSLDGITWNSQSTPADNNWNVITWSPELSLLVAMSTTGTDRVMTSPDGINWTLRSTPGDSLQWAGLCWSPDLDLFVGVSGSPASNKAMTSANGTSWTLRDLPAAVEDQSWDGVVWSPELGLFAAVSTNGASQRVITSPDGINWTARTTPVNQPWADICWSGEFGLFVSVGGGGAGAGAMGSYDGINWFSSSTAPNQTWEGVAWSPELSKFAAVGVSGTGNRIMTASGPGRRLHKLVKGVGSDADGEARLHFWPRLRGSPDDNSLIIHSNPKGTFRLESNMRQWDHQPGPGGGLYNIAFSAIEAL